MLTVGDVKITTGHLTLTGIVLIVVGSIIAIACCIIAYRKRKALAEGARVASAYVRRASETLRSSFRGGRNADGGTQTNTDNAPVNDAHKDVLECLELQNDAMTVNPGFDQPQE